MRSLDVVMIDPQLERKIVLVTGANNLKGIGAAVAIAFARQGAKVLLSYLRLSPQEFGIYQSEAGQAVSTTVDYIAPAPLAVCPVSSNSEVVASPNREQDLLTLYKDLRDEVLLPSNVGPKYVNMYYEYGPELAGILLTDPTLLGQTKQFLEDASEEFGSLLPGSISEISLTQSLYDQADALVKDLAAAGSDDFSAELIKVWTDLGLDESINVKTTDIWQEMNKLYIYLPLARK